MAFMKIISKDKNTLEIETEGIDHSLLQMLSDRLSSEKGIEFVSYKVEHPLVGHPKLVIRTKSGDPQKILLKAVSEIKKEVEDFRSQFKEISK